MDREVLNSISRQNFISFIERSFKTVSPGSEYIPNWHIDLIADRLQAVENGEIKRLIINIPPRYLKSICVNIAWPAWLLGHNPTKRIISASYSQAIATRHSLDTRLILESDWYKKLFPQTKITNDQNEKDKFITTRRGFRLAVGVGGSLTGEGGDILIIDDPHNPVNIMSKLARDTVTSWYEQVFASRLDSKKKGAIVLIMQRLHEEDLTGYLLKRAGNIWHHLKIPAIAEKNITYHYFSNPKRNYTYPERTPLHPSRESVENLKLIKEELGSHTFGSQYQQNPLPADSGMIKLEWLKRYDLCSVINSNNNPFNLGLGQAFQGELEESILNTRPKNESEVKRSNNSKLKAFYQSWDSAIKSANHNDYSVCTTWAEDENSYYLIDVLRVKMEYPELKRTIINSYKKYKPTAVLMEDKASGQILTQELKKETKIPIIPINPTIDKISRFAAVTTFFEAGKVKLPESAEWLLDYETELLSFPKSANDDQVDSTSQFLNWVKNKHPSSSKIRVF